MQVERNNYIDFLRGWAAVNIIFIHTCFWSGESYVPEMIKSISLSLDVPFFFFLSGWSGSYAHSFQKSLRSILKIYKKYVIFVFFYFALLLVIGILFTNSFQAVTLENFYSNLFFFRRGTTVLPVVMGSIWFMPVFFSVVPIGSFCLDKLWSRSKTEAAFLRNCIFLLGIAGGGLLYSYWTGNFFLMPTNILFYLFFYFFGAIGRYISIRRFCAVPLIIFDIILMKLLGMYFGWNISNMQSLKFPPSIIWLLYSLIMIIAALWGKTRISKRISACNPLCKIGRCALLFYFCQGIGSSLLYFVLPYFDWMWWIKLPTAFMLNLLSTIVFVWLLSRIYHLWALLEKKISQKLLIINPFISGAKGEELHSDECI